MAAFIVTVLKCLPKTVSENCSRLGQSTAENTNQGFILVDPFCHVNSAVLKRGKCPSPSAVHSSVLCLFCGLVHSENSSGHCL